MKKLNLEHTFVYGTLGIIAITASLFAYTLFSSIDVVRDWTVTTEKDSYSVGDTVYSTSTYHKVLSVNGQSKRYIECLNPDGVWIRYPVLERPADKAQGKGETRTATIISSVIPNMDTKCRIYINVEYTIYRYRSFREEVTSNEFRLVKKDGVVKTHLPVVKNTPTLSSVAPKVTLPTADPAPAPQADVDTPPAVIIQDNPTERQPLAIEQIIQNIINSIQSIGGR